MPRDGALADFQIDARKVVDVVDAHLVGNREAAKGNIDLIRRVEPASGEQRISLSSPKQIACHYSQRRMRPKRVEYTGKT